MSVIETRLASHLQNEIHRIESEFLEISKEIGIKTAELERFLKEQQEMREQISTKLDQSELKKLYELTDQISSRQIDLANIRAEKQYMSYYHSNLLKISTIHNLTETTILRLIEDEAVRNLPADELNLIIGAQEEERGRLSRQMHDGPAQTVANIVFLVDIINRYIDTDLSIAKKELERMREAARTTLQDIRSFIFELRPMMLDDLGLIPTLIHYIDLLNERERIAIKLKTSGGEMRYKQVVEDLIFRMLQELLVGKLNFAEDEIILLDVHTDSKVVRINIQGNVKRFNSAQLEEEGKFGLRVINARINAIGGSFKIESDDKFGSKVEIVLPIGEKDIVKS